MEVVVLERGEGQDRVETIVPGVSGWVRWAPGVDVPRVGQQVHVELDTEACFGADGDRVTVDPAEGAGRPVVLGGAVLVVSGGLAHLEVAGGVVLVDWSGPDDSLRLPLPPLTLRDVVLTPFGL